MDNHEGDHSQHYPRFPSYRQIELWTNSALATMSWNQKYWDILANIYWMPRYMGLESITQKKWPTSQIHICIPKNEIPTNAGIYVRKRAEAEQMDYLRSKDEALNHIFDLTLAIAGDEVVQRLLFKPLGFDVNGPIMSLGREVKVRYGWKRNVTQQDGFFVSPETPCRRRAEAGFGNKFRASAEVRDSDALRKN